MEEIRLFSLEQYEAYNTVGQIRRLEDMQSQMQAVNVAMGKGIKSTLSSIDRKINILRQGTLSEHDVLEASMQSQFGSPIGLSSDAALINAGFEKLEK